jgi:glyoxylase-like metal-dependent hydrolase (beta-lactamase superfamily II)
MDAPYQAAPDVHVLPSHLPIPGAGVLPINAYVLLGEEPVLIDTGLGIFGEQFLDAVSSIVGLPAIRWVWLTHDDADHTGSIQAVLEAAPNARLVTHGMNALRMSSWWRVPLERTFAIRPGDRLPIGDRTLRAVAPPLFDNPMSVGLLDEATGSLFSVDSFGALLPEATQDAAEVPADALAGGMRAWASADSPWSHIVDRARFAQVLDGVRRLQPTRIFSSHLPAASGTSLDRFLGILESVPDAEPIPAPSHEEFTLMLQAMAPPAQREPAAV